MIRKMDDTGVEATKNAKACKATSFPGEIDLAAPFFSGMPCSLITCIYIYTHF